MKQSKLFTAPKLLVVRVFCLFVFLTAVETKLQHVSNLGGTTINIQRKWEGEPLSWLPEMYCFDHNLLGALHLISLIKPL